MGIHNKHSRHIIDTKQTKTPNQQLLDIPQKHSLDQDLVISETTHGNRTLDICLTTNPNITNRSKIG